MYLSPEQLSIAGAFTETRPQITSLLEQGSGASCEDVILVDTDRGLFGVFDGATSLFPETFAGSFTGGRLAAQVCAESFAASCGSLYQAAVSANDAIRLQAQKYGVNYTRKERLWSASAAVVQLENDRLSWCQMGDCQILLLNCDGSWQRLTADTGHDQETLKLWRERSSQQEGPIMDVMASEILRVRRRMNIDYGVFNGEEAAMYFLRAGSAPLRDVAGVILFTDGLMLPQVDPTAPPDMEGLVALLQQGGLSHLHQHVRNLQGSDPWCRNYPRFKTHDDIGCVLINFF